MPLHKHLGVKLLDARPGYAELLIPFKPELVGDPRSNRLHGGITATMLDSSGGAAAMTTLTTPDDKISTLDIRIDYLEPGKSADLIAYGEIVRSGQHVVVCRMWARHKGEDAIVAEGKAVYRVTRFGEQNA